MNRSPSSLSAVFCWLFLGLSLILTSSASLPLSSCTGQDLASVLSQAHGTGRFRVFITTSTYHRFSFLRLS